MEWLQHKESAGNHSILRAGKQSREKAAEETLPLLKSVRNGSQTALECFQKEVWFTRKAQECQPGLPREGWLWLLRKLVKKACSYENRGTRLISADSMEGAGGLP